MSDAPSFLAAAIEARPETESEDKLQKLKDTVAEVRDLVQEKADLEQRLKDANIKIEEMKRKTLPDLMVEAGVPSITIEAEGNNPSFTAEVKPDYYANIPAEWPDEKRKKAFAYLSSDEWNAGDLIKTEIIIPFAREDRQKALTLAKKLAASAQGYQPTLKESVNFQTLTSWLKEQAEKHKKKPEENKLPDLEKINGRIGVIVNIKPLKGK
jgi:hypothetical protein